MTRKNSGSCLFPQASDEQMEEWLKAPEEMNKRTYIFPNSALKLNDKKINPHDFINSLENEDLNKAILRIVPKINLNKINQIINDTLYISDIRKKFYQEIILKRYEEILLPAYEKLYDKVIDKNYELYKDKIEAIYSEEFGKDFKNKTNFESLVKSNMKEDILSLNKDYLIYKDDEDNEYLVTNIKDKDIKVIKTKDISELLEQNENNGEEE